MNGMAHQASIRLRARSRLALVALAFAGACSVVRPSTDLAAQAKSARAPAEHAAVAAAYRDRAQHLRGEAAEHAALAGWWSGLAGGMAAGTGTGRYEEAQHCRRFSELLSSAAAEADAMATVHEQLAQP